jgi:hypothetical protein
VGAPEIGARMGVMMRAMRLKRVLGSGWSRALWVGAAVLAAVGVAGVVPPVASAAPQQQAPTWTKLNPPVKPSARREVAMAYDAATGTVVLFGGNLSIYIESGSVPAGDTWTWNGTTWTKQDPAVHPSARSLAAMAYDAATGTVVMFGGLGTNDESLGDTWTWNGTTWTQQHPAKSPTPDASAMMAYDAATGTVVLVGTDGTWTWNGTTWTHVASPAASPPVVFGAAMAYDAANGTVVVNDVAVVGTGEDQVAETWTWDGTTWTQQAPATSPPARFGAYMAYDAATGTVVLFGGSDVNTNCMLSGTWTWDGTTWTQQAPAENPGARAIGGSGVGMVYDAATGNAVLFGGYTTASRCRSDTEVNLNQTWTWG